MGRKESNQTNKKNNLKIIWNLVLFIDTECEHNIQEDPVLILFID